jgi:hypothetical protein
MNRKKRIFSLLDYERRKNLKISTARPFIRKVDYLNQQNPNTAYYTQFNLANMESKARSRHQA